MKTRAPAYPHPLYIHAGIIYIPRAIILNQEVSLAKSTKDRMRDAFNASAHFFETLTPRKILIHSLLFFFGTMVASFAYDVLSKTEMMKKDAVETQEPQQQGGPKPVQPQP